VETSPIRIHAELETEVRAVVLREDALAVVFEDVERHGGRLAEVLDVLGLPRRERVYPWQRLHVALILF
jgi:hypothetical protein